MDELLHRTAHARRRQDGRIVGGVAREAAVQRERRSAVNLVVGRQREQHRRDREIRRAEQVKRAKTGQDRPGLLGAHDRDRHDRRPVADGELRMPQAPVLQA